MHSSDLQCCSHGGFALLFQQFPNGLSLRHPYKLLVMKLFCLYIRICPYSLIAWWLLGVRFWSQWHWFYCLVRWIIQISLIDALPQVSNLVSYANILVWADLTTVHLLTLCAGRLAIGPYEMFNSYHLEFLLNINQILMMCYLWY